MTSRGRLIGFLLLGMVSLATSLITYVIWAADRERALQAEMQGAPSSIFTALAHRCMAWAETYPEPQTIDTFRLSGLKGAGLAHNGYPVFSDEAEQVFIALYPASETQFGCQIDDRSEPWSASERRKIEEIALILAQGFATKPYKSVDLRYLGGFHVAHAYLPEDVFGMSIGVFRATREDGAPYTFVSIGHGEQAEGGEGA